jgi:pimeloyl-ACP methyl ester carboxylesterase
LGHRQTWNEQNQGCPLCGWPDVERLAEGRERIYLDRFWNQLSANPAAIDEESCQRYAKLYARPGAMHSAFEQFAAFHQDAIDNRALDVTEAVIPNSGHWLMEEQPAATIAAVRAFLEK